MTVAEGRAVIARVSDQPLDVAAHDEAVAHAEAGARVVFRGVVRDHDGGRGVVRLEYEAHPSAEQVLAGIVSQFAAEESVLGVAASHRVGVLEVGDVALAVAVSTAHRREAFDVCARLVDEIKHRLPVWKRQVFDDGSDEWVNCP
jgi:molybdopterin synthase catalytic subunit